MTSQTLQPPPDDHFQNIYNGDQTHLYDELILCEDVNENLLKTLQQLVPHEEAHILDVGAGTGRVSRLLAPVARELLSVDLNIPMLRIAQKYQRARSDPWHIVAGDAINLPVKTDWADMAVAGWAFGHFTGWFENWIAFQDRALEEMQRTLRSGGLQVIIETMGTGFPVPMPPTENLATYYNRMETVHGFSRKVIRMDYAFPNVKIGAELIGFFFGEELAQQFLQAGTVDLIEWTGIWWRMV